MAHDHHDHDHHHDNELDPMAARVRALETILTQKGLIDPAAIDAIVETYETQGRAAQRRQGRGEGLERSGLMPTG